MAPVDLCQHRTFAASPIRETADYVESGGRVNNCSQPQLVDTVARDADVQRSVGQESLYCL